MIGKQGVERSYEKQLRGEKGVEILLRDARGRIQGRYMDCLLYTSKTYNRNINLFIFSNQSGTYGRRVTDDASRKPILVIPAIH